MVIGFNCKTGDTICPIIGYFHIMKTRQKNNFALAYTRVITGIYNAKIKP